MATQVDEAVPAPAEEPADAAAREPSHSGRLMLRMPASLHTELARAAENDRVSLNAYVIGVLAASVSWRSPDGAETTTERLPAWARRTVLANLVVMTLLAVAAAVLVVVALVNR
jgi:HicB family